ncbi:MAG: hypothetical protein HUJ97_08015 [Bacteroidales bacterium]|nr:hypothetical protein [Bacteroidales bacterium]
MNIENFESCLPGKVTDVDGDFITVRPCIRKVARNGVIDISNIPIPGIKILRYGTSDFSIEIPVKKGDTVLLIAISRDSREWKSKDWPDTIPKSCSGNTLCDFVALPIYSAKKSEKAGISFEEDGTLKFHAKKFLFDSDVEVDGNLNAKDDVTSMDGTISLTNHQHASPVGPTSPPTPSAPKSLVF